MPAYSRLYHNLGDGDPYLFLYEDGHGRCVAYVFLKRPIKTLHYINMDTFKDEYYDIITPYGYGGPLYDKADEQLIRGFRKEFEEFCRDENIVSEFIRFHPLLENHRYLDELMNVEYDRDTVFVDLNQTEKEIYRQYHHNHQRNIRKAREYENLEFRAFRGQDATEQAESFYEIYTETMDRVGASPYHYFSLEYVTDLLSGLNGGAMIGATIYEGEMISAALCMYKGGFMHYHLGCSKADYFHLGTNVYQFHNIALWAKEQEISTFYLGGGHVGRDSLFRFKQKFSPDGILPFYIGKKIHRPQSYNDLVENWKKHYARDSTTAFFPAYRKKMPV